MNIKEEIMELTTSSPKVGLVERKKSRGGLHKYANPDLIPFEGKVWEKTIQNNMMFFHLIRN